MLNNFQHFCEGTSEGAKESLEAAKKVIEEEGDSIDSAEKRMKLYKRYTDCDYIRLIKESQSFFAGVFGPLVLQRHDARDLLVNLQQHLTALNEIYKNLISKHNDGEAINIQEANKEIGPLREELHKDYHVLSGPRVSP